MMTLAGLRSRLARVHSMALPRCAAISSGVAVVASMSGFCRAGGVGSGVALTHEHHDGGRSWRGRVSQPAVAKVMHGDRSCFHLPHSFSLTEEEVSFS